MVLAKLSWQNQMVDPVVIFSCVFSLRAVHSVAREVSRALCCAAASFSSRWCVRFKGKKSGRRRCVRGFFTRRTAARGETLCHEGVRGRSGLCVAICRDGSFPYMARRGVGDARETRNRAGGETDRPLPSRLRFGKNAKFSPSFANFAKMQNSNAKPLDISF